MSTWPSSGRKRPKHRSEWPWGTIIIAAVIVVALVIVMIVTTINRNHGRDTEPYLREARRDTLLKVSDKELLRFGNDVCTAKRNGLTWDDIEPKLLSMANNAPTAFAYVVVGGHAWELLCP